MEGLSVSRSFESEESSRLSAKKGVRKIEEQKRQRLSCNAQLVLSVKRCSVSRLGNHAESAINNTAKSCGR